VAIFAVDVQRQMLASVKVVTMDSHLAKADVENLHPEGERLSVALPAGG
jgi:hypothetical protein